MESEKSNGAATLITVVIGLFIAGGISLDPSPLANVLAVMVVGITGSFAATAFRNNDNFSVVLGWLFGRLVFLALCVIGAISVYSIVVRPLGSDALSAGALVAVAVSLFGLLKLQKKDG